MLFFFQAIHSRSNLLKREPHYIGVTRQKVQSCSFVMIRDAQSDTCFFIFCFRESCNLSRSNTKEFSFDKKMASRLSDIQPSTIQPSTISLSERFQTLPDTYFEDIDDALKNIEADIEEASRLLHSHVRALPQGHAPQLLEQPGHE